jgi:small subunit ribosomal protein S1
MSDNENPVEEGLAPTEMGSELEGQQVAPEVAPMEPSEPGAAVPGSEVPQDDAHPMMSEEYSYAQPKRGEIRMGHVISISADGIVVDLGLKREGFIPQDDLRQVGDEAVAALHEGEEIAVFVLRPENDKEGNVLVSWHRARQEQDWVDAQRLHDTGEVWEGKIKGYNRGGLIAPYGKIRGFVPASQITGISRRMDSTSLQAHLAEMVGQTMPLKVIEVDRNNRRLILSERNARREWRALRRESLLAELQEGDRVHGVVSNICDFGVFVDLGGTDGLVHISELSWRRTTHPSEVVKIGDEVEAYVLRVDRENRRIGLSLRLTEPDPWQTAEERYAIGQLVTGTVTKMIAFGAFAALDDGIEGLIHISELSDESPKHPSEVVSQGQFLPLRVVKIEASRRRMGLSLKRVTAEEWAEWEACHKAAVAEEEPETEVEVEPVVAELDEALAVSESDSVAEAAEVVEEAVETQATNTTAEETTEAEVEPESVVAELDESAAGVQAESSADAAQIVEEPGETQEADTVDGGDADSGESPEENTE